ncbi:putative serine/threonine-protein kinase PkwA [Deinococcus xinjiangensis]|uniref:Serine/threonine-protein kinase PkwA n=1 Tax=Deinococcus xinjiangensis TaxID=457454 RepID=A0ABP9VBC0_9DEIO
MFRSFLLGALALASVASAVTPQTVKAEWTLPQTQFLGFTDTGDLVTRGMGAVTLNVLDAATGQARRTVVFPEVTSGRDFWGITFTPDLKTWAWVNERGDAVTVRTPQGEWTTPPASGVQYVRRLSLSPDGKALAISNANGYTQLWDTATRTRRHTLMLMRDPLAFSPDSKTLAATGIYGKSGVRLWDVPTGEKRLDLPQVETIPRPFQFLPDGTLLTGDSRIRLDLSKMNQGDFGVSISFFPRYTEACPQGIPWKSCVRGVWNGSVNSDASLFLFDILRTPQNLTSSLLYDKYGKLLKILNLPQSSNFPTLTPDAKRLIWQSNQGELLGAKVP